MATATIAAGSAIIALLAGYPAQLLSAPTPGKGATKTAAAGSKKPGPGGAGPAASTGQKPASTGDSLSLEVENTFVSNYVFRGVDLFTNRARQNRRAYGPHTGAPAYQPRLTFTTPVRGLSFSLWASAAVQNRGDVDVDERLQKKAGGDNLLLTKGNLLATVFSGGTLNTTALLAEYPSNFLTDTSVSAVPGLYREENGLKRADEIDLTIRYSARGRAGELAFGLVSYYLPNPVTTGTARRDGSATEVFVSYSPPVLTQFKVTLFADIETSNLYASPAYEHEFKLGANLSLRGTLSAGYQVQDRLQGISDVTAEVRLVFRGFHLAVAAAYRPTLAFQERAIGDDVLPDGTVADRSLPVWLNGNSTIFDGLVNDPAQTNSPIHDLLNAYYTDQYQRSGAAFTYTPRTKLPRTIWWVSIGHTFKI